MCNRGNQHSSDASLRSCILYPYSMTGPQLVNLYIMQLNVVIGQACVESRYECRMQLS